ncbi:hypothetical protein GOP47_0030929 [Adiantum capillus-veneris]|nr:hypothetical protein GOP47_0030929 [Adiantum capillus-veneris]
MEHLLARAVRVFAIAGGRSKYRYHKLGNGTRNAGCRYHQVCDMGFCAGGLQDTLLAYGRARMAFDTIDREAQRY